MQYSNGETSDEIGLKDIIKDYIKRNPGASNEEVAEGIIQFIELILPDIIRELDTPPKEALKISAKREKLQRMRYKASSERRKLEYSRTDFVKDLHRQRENYLEGSDLDTAQSFRSLISDYESASSGMQEVLMRIEETTSRCMDEEDRTEIESDKWKHITED